jgi:hypothetical protein
MTVGKQPLGFAGGSLDRKTNPKLLIMPLDRIYPVRDLGTDPAEIYRRSASGEGVLQGAEGFCFFDSHQLPAAKSVSCVAKHESGNDKIIYRVEMELMRPPSKRHVSH